MRKEVIREGDGNGSPKTGNTVQVHYVGTLTDGTKFDSSRDRSQPFSFTVGIGQVIQCWDTLTLQMTKGELAKFTCPYQSAYGEQGYPPVIPPKSTLIFEVELLDF